MSKRMTVVRFLEIPQGVKQPCPFCAANSVDFCSRYPSDDLIFEELVVLFCTKCGGGYVPGAAGLIADYYSNDYAKNNRKDRDIDPVHYFSNENKDVKYKKYFSRASSQVEILRKYGANLSVGLDYGSGPGYLLWKSGAAEKWAIELDSHSKKYLEYLGVKVINQDQIPLNYFNFVVASHSIEHLVAENLFDNAKALCKSLQPGGIFLIEVPQAGHSYLQLNTRQDPHTLFFTPEALYRFSERLVDSCNMKIVAAFSRAKGVVPLRKDSIYQPVNVDEKHFFYSRSGGLTVVLQHK